MVAATVKNFAASSLEPLELATKWLFAKLARVVEAYAPAELSKLTREILSLAIDIQHDVVRHVSTVLSIRVTVLGVSVDPLTASAVGLTALVLLCRWVGTARMLRWPILLVILACIFADLVAYAAVRYATLAVERVLSRTTRRRRREVTLAAGDGYAAWLQRAEELDAIEGRDRWRDKVESDYYDFRHALATTQRLREARERGDAPALVALLHQHCLKPNVAGIHEMELYARARAGTKRVVERFVAEICVALRWLAATAPRAPATLAMLRAAHVSFGNEALVLSGGATLGTYHLGVLKALTALRMLPKVISGTSAGAVVAAIACCRTDDELAFVLSDQQDLFREMGPQGPFTGSTWSQIQNLFAKGRMYDAEWFQSCLQWFTKGFTFLEAFEHSGRVLNITCTPLRSRGLGAPPLMLNHVETPHIDIASAVCASSAVPGLIEAVTLKEKAPDGTLREYHHLDSDSDDRIRVADGSFESDLPLRELGATFGCPFTIVSQVNPHIVCFHAWPNGRPGRPSAGRERTGAWRGGFLLGALEVALKEDLRRHLRTVQQLNLSLDLIGIDWTRMWLQADGNYGSVMITPDFLLRDCLNLVANLRDPRELARMIAEMERATFEASALLRTRFDVRHALDELIAAAGLRDDVANRWLHDADEPPPSTSRQRAAAAARGETPSRNGEAARRAKSPARRRPRRA